MKQSAHINRLLEQARSQSYPDAFLHVLETYYENADFAGLAQYDDADLVAGADSHCRLVRMPRKPGEVAVRVVSPGVAGSFTPEHTVVEIVADNMPFLIDSLSLLLNREGLSLAAMVHPIFNVERDADGKAVAMHRANDSDGGQLESLIVLRLADTSIAQAQALAEKIRDLIDELRSVVESEHKLRGQLLLVNQMVLNGGRNSSDAETVSFLSWLADNHFLLMGFCEYDLVQDQDNKLQLQARPETALGVLAKRGVQPYSTGFASLSEEDKAKWLLGDRLILNKSQRRSRIHRNAYYDLVGIQKLDDSGKVIGQWRFIGLYTAQAYLDSVWNIPVLRNKADYALKHCDFVRGSHKEKTLRYVLQTYPRDEMFEIGNNDLTEIAAGIVSLTERPRVRLFARVDDFKRYVSALVYLPKEQFSTEMRQRIGDLLQQAFAATETEFEVQLTGDNPLARVHYLFRTQAADLPEFDSTELENRINGLVRGWHSDWQNAAKNSKLPADTVSKYSTAFSAGYREAFSPEEALADVACAEQLADKTLVTRFGDQSHNSNAPYWLKMYVPDRSPSLSKTLPMLENMGLTVYAEVPYRLKTDQGSVGLSHFSLSLGEGLSSEFIEQEDTRAQLLALFEEVWAGRVENDRFNALVAATGISWRSSVLIRALAKFLKQATLPFGQNYVEQTLIRHSGITAKLVALFEALLHPENADQQRAQAINAELDTLLAEVPNLDDDRILNAFRTVILAVRRTNFWQTDEAGYLKQDISFKIESKEIPFLPKPWPMYEIWVYSPRVEGTHLRGSKVARGGLRWSDRFEDFRTEVLGLVKAQMVKNSVIVPNGSKGGFVCKQLPNPADRQAYLAEGVACYKIFINALLDITDNRQQGRIVPPPQVHRRDSDDPYLVVAADKGTATFSDTANGIAQAHGFWLDDAFASGGSAGYDHKGMGITARGAWESVKRHFRHLGKDIQKEDFTVVGIGDMGGDVFGNGMLLSEHIRLKAAFNHRHIFIDPNPDAAKSHAERKRLFEAVAGWDQYNPALISQGGGVYERSAKSIPLSPEVKEWLGLSEDSMAPNDLIRELLKAEVELVYNGGIGTYIKAASESHADARDRANDPVRVNGGELRAKVLGEGGNLGATQLGRIEYWQSGGRCCTDAIDNSAGVDCSDHEVNIKILLGEEVRNGRLTLLERDRLLKEMTDDVARLVLQNNYLQTQILAMNQLDPAGYLNAHNDLMHYLEQHAGLDRAIENLPDAEAVKARAAAGLGLANPEVAVLLAYSKILCQDQLLDSDLPDDENFLPVLTHYFPEALQQRYGDSMKQHYLKREIIANQLANRVINRMGISFVQRFSEENNASAADVARAYWIADALLDGEARFQALQALDNRLPAKVQMRLMADVARLMNRVARQLLRNKRPFGDIGKIIEHYRQGVADFMQQLPERVRADEHPSVAERESELRGYGVFSEEEAAVLARLPFAENVLSVLDLAEESGKPVATVAKAYFMLSERLNMSWIYRAIASLPRDNIWQNQACLAVREDAQNIHLALARSFLNADNSAQTAENIAAARAQIADMQRYGQTDLAMLSALMRNLARIGH